MGIFQLATTAETEMGIFQLATVAETEMGARTFEEAHVRRLFDLLRATESASCIYRMYVTLEEAEMLLARRLEKMEKKKRMSAVEQEEPIKLETATVERPVQRSSARDRSRSERRARRRGSRRRR